MRGPEFCEWGKDENRSVRVCGGGMGAGQRFGWFRPVHSPFLLGPACSVRQGTGIASSFPSQSLVGTWTVRVPLF